MGTNQLSPDNGIHYIAMRARQRRIVACDNVSGGIMRKFNHWTETFFNDFQPFFGTISNKTTNEQVRFIIKLLSLKKGMTFLDCPCGIGRVSIPLAQLRI